MEFEEKVEKLSTTNGQLLKGADLIDDIKAKLEEQCPSIVSCVDTIAFAVAESMMLRGLLPQPKLDGYRDSLSSRAAEAEDNLPFPNWSMDQMLNLFKNKRVQCRRHGGFEWCTFCKEFDGGEEGVAGDRSSNSE
ncbi:peroxidase 28-like [Senna tora]|uniref:peroxidase n=1 Tax=Senna tora TaxID=362788 RepID=A0A834SJY2_9FABA|nr:peroxidase 28-like [Senna tora]